MNYEITEETNNVRIKVKLEKRELAKQPKRYCGVKECEAILREEGYNINRILKGASLIISNTALDSRPFEGEWVFVQNIEEVPKKKSFRNRVKKVATKPASKTRTSSRQKKITEEKE